MRKPSRTHGFEHALDVLAHGRPASPSRLRIHGIDIDAVLADPYFYSLDASLQTAVNYGDRDAVAGALRKHFLHASDSALRAYLECALRTSRYGPTLSSLLTSLSKLIPCRSGNGPFFDSSVGGGTRLVPSNIREIMSMGSAIEGLVACFEAIARNSGATALLQEEAVPEHLILIASGRSRASSCLNYDNPIGKACALLEQIAESQGNDLGRFFAVLVGGPCRTVFYAIETGPWTMRAAKLAYERTGMQVVYLQGALIGIEWLMMAGLETILHISTSELKLTISKLNERQSFVHFHSASVLFPGMRDLRKSNVFTRRKDSWRYFFLMTLERRTTMHAVRLIAGFLDIALAAKGAVNAAATSASPSLGKVLRTAAAGVPTPPAEWSVIQPVEHHDPAALIGPQEAEMFVQVQEAGFVERNLGAGIFHDEEEAIFLGTFNRSPKALQAALDHGRGLQRCREALEAEGYTWRLPCGARVFVHPWQYDLVIRQLPPHITHRDIVFAASLEHLLEEDITTIESFAGSFRGAWIKGRQQLVVHADSSAQVPSEQENQTPEPSWRLIVERTFLCVTPVIPLRRNAASVIQSATSTSEPDERRNPRRTA